MATSRKSKTWTTAEKAVYAALQILKERDGSAPGREVMTEVERRVDFNDWEKETYPKTGNTRWKTILQFYSIDCVKAGFLVKKQGVWFLTPEGEAAIDLGPHGLLTSATEAYTRWRQEQPSGIDEPSVTDETIAQAQEATISEIEQQAIDGLKQQLDLRNAYEFQDLVAALLRGMGYFTPFVAPRGKDGGVDVIAYRDPLGTVTPRIKVQIKHRGASATVQEIRQLRGLLQNDGDVGIFVSTGGFTPDAKTSARESSVHVELIDLDRFIALWREFYPRMDDEDRALFPLMPIYFYAPAG